MASLASIASVAPPEPAGNVVPAWRLQAKREERARRLKVVRSTILGTVMANEEAAA